MQKTLVSIIAYNEDWIIESCLKQFKDLIFDVVVLLSEKPWNGKNIKPDKTEEILKKNKVKYFKHHWLSEAEQRNFILERTDADLVITIDADEFMTQEDWHIVGEALSRHPHTNLFAPKEIKEYWKNLDSRIVPSRIHLPIIALNPRCYRFFSNREVLPDNSRTILPVTLYHLSYVRPVEKIAEKHKTFSHANVFNDEWIEYFKNWKQGDKIQIPTYQEAERVEYDPCPKEIKQYVKSICKT